MQYYALQSRSSLSLGGDAEATVCFPVTQDAGLEVVMAQFWKSEGSSEISASVAFHGIAPASMNALPAPGASASVGLVLSPLLVAPCRHH